ncbi:hypothetical protein QAD02_010154 [Eretmocerus hayati]|uniref:Uncharacterized protein n=1 Tax=Eretmocerus hayati TaxID=131215 RepID=A0ACC2NC39_9HYME|nr:hypothetical protein QAD02_010154 [Eretmocerus hayati]
MGSLLTLFRIILVIKIGLKPSYGRSFFFYGSATRKSNPSGVPDNIKFISKTEWEAVTPKIPSNNLKIKPFDWVIISHTDTGSCFEQIECSLLMHRIQTMNMETKGWENIGYNFLIGGDGNIYEGLGWDREGLRTRGYHKKNLEIALIGDFESSEPTVDQLESLKKFLKYGVQLKELDKEYKLVGERQLAITNSPGLRAYNVIRTWDHWNNTRDENK